MSFSSILQRTCSTALGSMQMMFAREAHVFNRAILKCKVRCHFPKPREVKRINVHGWDTRMASPEGRRVLMRRILKGRHCVAH